MKNKILVIVSIIGILLVSGCVQTKNQEDIKNFEEDKARITEDLEEINENIATKTTILNINKNSNEISILNSGGTDIKASSIDIYLDGVRQENIVCDKKSVKPGKIITCTTEESVIGKEVTVD